MKFSVLAASASILLLGGASLADAQEQPRPQASFNVRDLDLSQPSDQAKAETRLQASASAACEQSGDRGLTSVDVATKCKNDIVQKGRADIARLAAEQTAQRQAVRQKSYAAGFQAGRADSAGAVKVRVHHHRHVVHHHKVATAPVN